MGKAQASPANRMLDAVLVTGSEETVAARLNQFFEWGAGELLISVQLWGPRYELRLTFAPNRSLVIIMLR